MTGPKPAFFGADHARIFKHAGVAAAYRHRPPYPAEVFAVLVGLIADQPRAVLDVGAGSGALARPLSALVDRVHAVDCSAAMIEEGRRLQGGASPNLTWMLGPAEEATLDSVRAGDGRREPTAGYGQRPASFASLSMRTWSTGIPARRWRESA